LANLICTYVRNIENSRTYKTSLSLFYCCFVIVNQSPVHPTVELNEEAYYHYGWALRCVVFDSHDVWLSLAGHTTQRAAV